MYYRLNDLQCGGCLHTGFNASSLEQLKEDFISYVSIDVGNDQQKVDFEDECMFVRGASEFTLSGYLLYAYELELESNMIPFPEQDEE